MVVIMVLIMGIIILILMTIEESSMSIFQLLVKNIMENEFVEE
jgi:hypothetical protein